MQKSLPQAPTKDPFTAKSWLGPDGFWNRLYERVNEANQITWSQIDSTGSNLTDIETRTHASLQSIGTVDETDTDTTKDKHISNALAKGYTDHLAKTNLNAHGNTTDADITIGEGFDIAFGTTTGGMIGNSATQKMGFWGVTPVVQPTALTAQLTTITYTEPGTPDYAIQDLTTTTPYGFVTADEGQSVLKVIANLQTRVAELETKLQAAGIIA